MTEPTTPIQPVAPTTTPAVNPATTPANSPTTPATTPTEFDPKALSDGDFAKIFDDPRTFKHDRFKSLNDRAKKADELEKAQQEAETKKLEEDKKFEELAGKHKAEADAAKQQIQQMNVKFALTTALNAEKVVDLDGALKLIDMSLITTDKDGNVTGTDKAIEDLKAKRAYLFGDGSPTSLGSSGGNSPSETPPGVKRFKQSQLQDLAFYKANRDDILKAAAAGMIEDDLSPRR